MARYKVGDRVVVRDDLILGDRYHMLDKDGRRTGYKDSFVGAMAEFAGKTVTISLAFDKYRIKEGVCNWTDEMFAGLEEEVRGEHLVDIDVSALDALLS